MIMTYVKGEYRVNAQSRDARELIKEMALSIRMLTQDLVTMDEENAQKVRTEIALDLKDACSIPLDIPSN